MYCTKSQSTSFLFTSVNSALKPQESFRFVCSETAKDQMECLHLALESRYPELNRSKYFILGSLMITFQPVSFGY